MAPAEFGTPPLEFKLRFGYPDVSEKEKEIEKKPIVALKAGRFEAKDKAAYLHTGSLAGRHEIYAAAFEQAGIIMAESCTELLDIAKALVLCPLPRSNRVAVLSSRSGYDYE